jgi:hypothetical protein
VSKIDAKLPDAPIPNWAIDDTNVKSLEQQLPFHTVKEHAGREKK